jgi:hypothetical protein
MKRGGGPGPLQREVRRFGRSPLASTDELHHCPRPEPRLPRPGATERGRRRTPRQQNGATRVLDCLHPAWATCRIPGPARSYRHPRARRPDLAAPVRATLERLGRRRPRWRSRTRIYGAPPARVSLERTRPAWRHRLGRTPPRGPGLDGPVRIERKQSPGQLRRSPPSSDRSRAGTLAPSASPHSRVGSPPPNDQAQRTGPPRVTVASTKAAAAGRVRCSAGLGGPPT